jgi:hypothetical protein
MQAARNLTPTDATSSLWNKDAGETGDWRFPWCGTFVKAVSVAISADEDIEKRVNKLLRKITHELTKSVWTAAIDATKRSLPLTYTYLDKRIALRHRMVLAAVFGMQYTNFLREKKWIDEEEGDTPLAIEDKSSKIIAEYDEAVNEGEESAGAILAGTADEIKAEEIDLT